jgi:hypothetical protein
MISIGSLGKSARTPGRRALAAALVLSAVSPALVANAQPLAGQPPAQPAPAPAPAAPVPPQPPAAPGYAPPPPGYYPPPPGYYYARPPAAPPEDPSRDRLFGIGYKAGNGIGFIGGDIIVGIVPHLNVDLQASYFRVETTGDTAHGFALAPMLQLHVTAGGRNTIYVGGGMQYARVELEGLTAVVKGVVANLGYIWKWPSGFGILLGGGVQYFWGVGESNGSVVISRDAGAYPNLEFGVRQMF